MKANWLLRSLGILTLIVLAILGLVYDNSIVAAQQSTDKIESLLLDQFSTQGTADFIVRFNEQVDLSPAYTLDWDARGEFVYNTLRDSAELSQANAKLLLDASGIKYQTFFAGNELYIWGGNVTLASDLSTLPEVNFIRATRTYYIDPGEETKPLDNLTWAGSFLASRALTTVESSPDAITAWGITDTKANQFWTSYGVQGDGIVVANIDTGVQWNHPALDQSFKCGTNPTNLACWYDPANICGVGGACDNNGHGTHTMGIMVADDDPGLSYIAGMAPNAKWIACKGCESNSCSDFALNACADWILAPNSNPANRPHIVNNSWGGGGGDTWYLVKVQAWRAAGIFPAFSAGNSGLDGCNSLGSPGDYQESFGTAAHDSSRNIWEGSSRGPSANGHDPYTKPNISAPGVSICSSVPTNSWSCGYIGTSMASPHTAGAIALLWSCNPSLVGSIDTTFQLLQNHTDTAPAGNCAAPPDGQGNYTYGYGYLDVLAAGKATCAGWTKILLPPGCPDWTRFDGEYYAGTGKVYFLGGRSGTDTDGTIYSYNPATNTCTSTGKTMLTPISNYSIVTLNYGSADQLCTFGGRDSTGAMTIKTQCYDPAANTVSYKADLPPLFTDYMPGGVAVVDNKAYIFGGFTNNSSPYNHAYTFEYNPLTNNFTPKGNLKIGRAFIHVAVVDGKIYAFGGDTSSDGTNLVAQTIAEVFNPAIGTWVDSSVADLTTASGEGRGFGFDSNTDYALAGKIVLAGGGIWPDDSNTVLTYDVKTNTYDTSFPDLNVERRDQAGFFIPGNPGKLFVFGGYSNASGYGSDSPPHAPPEYFKVRNYSVHMYLPIAQKH